MSSSTEAQAMIINATTFNPAKDIKYAKPKANPQGGKMISIYNAHTNKSLFLSSPLMLTWGVSEFVDDKTGKKSYNASLQFPGSGYETEATTKFLKAMEDFEKKIKADAIVNSKEWFNKPKMTDDVVDALFNPMLKYPKDKVSGEPDMTRSPTLSLKVPYYEGKFNVEIYDTEQRLLFPCDDTPEVGPVELIPKGSNVAVVLQCGGLYVINGKFGVTWKLFQAVSKPRANLRGRCMISLSSDEKTTLEKAAAEEDDDMPVVASDSHSSVVVADDDEPVAMPAPKVAEPVATQEPAPAEPAKKVVKKVVKKKDQI